MNPNLVHWQRVAASAESTPAETGYSDPPPVVNRPPSYISEDGVGYVIEAQPRSTVYDTELPVHPSERGRIGIPI